MKQAFQKARNIVLLMLTLVCINANAGERYYNIEVVVFAQDMPTSEVFEQTNSKIAWPKKLNRVSAFNKVPNQQLGLQGSNAKLARSKNYRPLLYASWQQGIQDNSLSNAVKITNANGTLDGFFRIQRGHLVNMIVDMEYSPDYAGATKYRLKEKRRFKFNEIHYLDHPKFGILARISPVNN